MCEVTPALIAFLRKVEGVRNKCYLDSAGKLTVGVGHLCLPGDNLKLGDSISDVRVNDFLTKDLQTALRALVNVPLTANQCVALISLAFNIGAGAFKRSAVLAELNAGNYRGAADAIEHWNKAGGKVVQGLVNRRAAERALFLTGMKK